MNRKKFTIAFIVAIFVITLFLPVGVVIAADEEDEKIEVNQCVKQIKEEVNENLEKNSSYIYWMKMLMSVFTALMLVLSIYAIYMTIVFINEK